jgi:hypothetical protein
MSNTTTSLKVFIAGFIITAIGVFTSDNYADDTINANWLAWLGLFVVVCSLVIFIYEQKS